MKREYVYKAFERFWHWTQALLILFMMATGFEIHGSLSFFGFDQAVRYHSLAAYGLLALIAFAVFWHLTTGEWRQYLPTTEHLKAQAEYYLFGIFRNAPHPDTENGPEQAEPAPEAGLPGPEGAGDSGDGGHRPALYVLPVPGTPRRARPEHG